MILYLVAFLCISGVHFGSAEKVESVMTTIEPLPVAQPQAQVTPSTWNGISCYVCNSQNDTACFDEKTLRKEFLQECRPLNGRNSIGCWRLEQWVNYDEDSLLKAHDRVVRQCAYLKQEHPCIYRSGFGAMISHCLCNTTACNGSENIPHNVFLTIFSTLFCLFTMKYFI